MPTLTPVLATWTTRRQPVVMLNHSRRAWSARRRIAAHCSTRLPTNLVRPRSLVRRRQPRRSPDETSRVTAALVKSTRSATARSSDAHAARHRACGVQAPSMRNSEQRHCLSKSRRITHTSQRPCKDTLMQTSAAVDVGIWQRQEPMVDRRNRPDSLPSARLSNACALRC